MNEDQMNQHNQPKIKSNGIRRNESEGFENKGENERKKTHRN